MKLILIAEDEHGAAEVLKMMLEMHGYRVTAASNGRSAIDLLAREKPAVIVSDFMMPHMNGAELGVAVRTSAALSEIPFIFTSGTNEDVVQRAFQDYDAFFAKPFDFKALIAAIEVLASSGREARIRSRDVGESMRQLLKESSFRQRIEEALAPPHAV